MKIGQFAKKYDINITTVRYYIERSLLTPERKNNQYIFNEECMRDMEKILRYKEYRFSLEEIELLFFLEKTSNGSDEDIMEIISDIFEENITESDLYYKGHFDFVIFESTTKTPVIAFEVNGIEHMADPKVRRRDLQKKQICEAHNFKLITVANSYARRYNYIKSFLKSFFAGE